MATNVSEALFAEMLLEAERLVEELVQIKNMWPQIIEKSTKDGINAATVNAKMSFEKLMTEGSNLLKQRAVEATQIIQKAQEEGFEAFLATHKAINRQGRRFILICSTASFVAALIGCFLGIKLSVIL